MEYLLTFYGLLIVDCFLHASVYFRMQTVSEFEDEVEEKLNKLIKLKISLNERFFKKISEEIQNRLKNVLNIRFTK